MKLKEHMAATTERLKKRRLALQEEALELGVEDVDAYVQAAIAAEDGLFIDDMPDDSFSPPPGQSLH